MSRVGKPKEVKRIIPVLYLPFPENSFFILSFGKSSAALRAKSIVIEIKGKFALTSLEIASSP